LQTKEGDTGTGILDVLDRYNFTVKEDEPLEKEVAIDPEMLGKVFENLLEVKDRKSKGTYYTPREIVHYMCQESLTNYLVTKLEGKVSKEDLETLIKYGETAVEHDILVQNHGKQTPTYSFKLPESIRKNAQLIDESLSNIKVCDPAVGSGAFLVGMMNEIVRARDTLTSYLGSKADRTIYEFKREAIQNSLYGVDIDPGAVEIAKLRLWLSLVVDEEDIRQIKPLPNLDYKIMQGNSLIELISPEFLAGRGDSIRKGLIERFNREKDELFEITSPSQKQRKREELNSLIREIFKYDQKKSTEVLKQKIIAIQSQQRLFEDKEAENQDKKKVREFEDKLKGVLDISAPEPKDHFEWHINFNEAFENGGFDIVIANPPYVSYGLRGGQKMSNEEKEFLKQKFPNSAEYKISLYALFMDKAVQISKPESGLQTFITPDSFLLGRFFSKIRKFIVNHNEIVYILLLPFSVFEATVGFSVVYTFKRRGQIDSKHKLTARYAETTQAVGEGRFEDFKNFRIHRTIF